MNTASKATLENEFGTHNEDEVIKQILEKGTLQETEVCLPRTTRFGLGFPSPIPSHVMCHLSCMYSSVY